MVKNAWGVVKIPGGVVKIPGMCGYCPRCNSRKVGTYGLANLILYLIITSLLLYTSSNCFGVDYTNHL